MHGFRTTFTALALILGGLQGAGAHDAFVFGIQMGDYGFNPPPEAHYSPAPITPYFGAYGAQTYHYGAPIVHHPAPAIRYHFFDDGRRGPNIRHGDRGRWRQDRGRWDNDRRDGGNGRGYRHDDGGNRR